VQTLCQPARAKSVQPKAESDTTLPSSILDTFFIRDRPMIAVHLEIQ
jgi:hypothetical protein